MVLKSLSLQNFRSYPKAQFTFNQKLTIIVGPNASGKTNLVEAIGILSLGKSFRTGKEKQLIAFEKQVTHVKGHINEEDEDVEIEVTLSLSPQDVLQKRYLINGVPKRRSALSGKLPTVLFTPLDLTIVSGQPGDKRRYLDEVLEQTDPIYSSALLDYGKALRQRNALLEFVQNSGHRDEERFSYWDDLLISNGQILTQKREAFIDYINKREKKLFPFSLVYDKSLMSAERLLQYKDAEVGAGMTLVGPQRDDVIIQSMHPVSKAMEDVKYFCSRGQQRLVTLELKNTQIFYLTEQLQVQPLLVLDDIFSELDSEHITQVMNLTHDFQTIITTTHKEFVSSHIDKQTAVVELKDSV
jgi:DNA replication and repair protein RecF